MIFQPALTPKQKALAINLDETIYGSFAEIGAGQEVVRTFFRAGGAAGTIARAISAYDMTMSDSMYGRTPDGRYVSESRLSRMLELEYQELTNTLKAKRKEDTRFFSFADTVAAKSYKSNRPCHGWVGVRFMHRPHVEFSQVILHIRMHDVTSVTQYESVGKLGVNLIYACFHHLGDTEKFISSLMDDLGIENIEVDVIKVLGPAFGNTDGRLLSLELVKKGLTKVALFDSDGQMIQATDSLYKKNVFVLRGSFRPPTFVNFDMLQSGLQKFIDYLGPEESKELVVLPEISMHNLRSSGDLDHQDFLDRVDLLSTLGHKCLITNYNNIHTLNTFVSSATNKSIVFTLGVHSVEEMLDPARYETDDLCILGAMGAMFGHRSRVYIYPAQEPDGTITTSKNLKLIPRINLLKEYLLENGYLLDIENVKLEHHKIWSKIVLKMIQDGVPGWETFVPELVAKTVKDKKLFQKR